MPETNTCRGLVLDSWNFPTRHQKKFVCTYGDNQPGNQRDTLPVLSYTSLSAPTIKKLFPIICTTYFLAKVTRCNKLQQRLVGMPQTGHINLYEELAKCSDSP